MIGRILPKHQGPWPRLGAMLRSMAVLEFGTPKSSQIDQSGIRYVGVPPLLRNTHGNGQCEKHPLSFLVGYECDSQSMVYEQSAIIAPNLIINQPSLEHCQTILESTLLIPFGKLTFCKLENRHSYKANQPLMAMFNSKLFV